MKIADIDTAINFTKERIKDEKVLNAKNEPVDNLTRQMFLQVHGAQKLTNIMNFDTAKFKRQIKAAAVFAKTKATLNEKRGALDDL